MAVGSQSMKREAGTIFGAVGGVLLGLGLSITTELGWALFALFVVTSLLAGRAVGMWLDDRAGRYPVGAEERRWR